MALGAKVINLIRLNLLDDPDQIGAVSQVSIVESEVGELSLLTNLVRILVKVIDTACVK